MLLFKNVMKMAICIYTPTFNVVKLKTIHHLVVSTWTDIMENMRKRKEIRIKYLLTSLKTLLTILNTILITEHHNKNRQIQSGRFVLRDLKNYLELVPFKQLEQD